MYPVLIAAEVSLQTFTLDTNCLIAIDEGLSKQQPSAPSQMRTRMAGPTWLLWPYRPRKSNGAVATSKTLPNFSND
jgi:hypothetical protein